MAWLKVVKGSLGAVCYGQRKTVTVIIAAFIGLPFNYTTNSSTLQK